MLKTPPMPKGRFFWGHLKDYRADVLEYERWAARTYGDVVRLNFGPRRAVLASHPDDVHKVLVSEAHKFRKSVIYRALLGRLLGNGLLISEGEFWQRQRKLAQPAFHHKRIQSYGEVMVAYAAQMLENWREGADVVIGTEMMRLTLRVVCKTLFNAEISAQADRVGMAVNALLELADEAMDNPIWLPQWVPTARHRRGNAATQVLNEIVYGFIAEHRQSGDVGDLLSMLLAAQGENGERMSDQQLRDESVTLVLAGHETTANALTWTWILLAQHPNVEAELHAELDRVLGDGVLKPKRLPTVEDLRQLEYTGMVMKETMRLYPPAPTVGREALEDFEVGGYHLPKGTIAVVPPHVVHRDARWFPNPEIFDPTRFSKANEAARRKFTYFPFGGGPRICIGNAFAEMEAVLILATVAHRYRLRLASNAPVVPEARITLRPRDAVPMRLEARMAEAVIA